MENTSADPTDASVLTFNNPRTLPQVIFHFLALRILAVLSKKHLGDLMQMRPSAGAKSLALFLFLPTFPLASLICRTAYCLYIACAQPWPSDWLMYITYLTSAALGQKTWDGGRGRDRTEKTDDDDDHDHDRRPSDVTAAAGAAASGAASSVELLHGDFEDYTLLRCSCARRLLCSRWNREMFPRLAFLALASYYSAATLFVSLRRPGYEWRFAAHDLLTGTPPGQHASEIPARGLEIVTGIDELNAVFALGGCTVSLCALVLEIVGWRWRYHPSLEDAAAGRLVRGRDEGLHLRSLRHSSMDARFELPVAMVLYVALANNSWSRVFAHRDVMPAGVVALVSAVCLFMGGRFLLSYLSWALRWGGVDAKNVFFWGAMLVTEWVAIHAFEDLFDMGACLKGGKCPDPLFLYKDSWSDYLWVY